GSRTASPSFSFAVTELRVAGEGDLLAQLEQLRRRLYGEGPFAPQKALARPLGPRGLGGRTRGAGAGRAARRAGGRRGGGGGPAGVPRRYGPATPLPRSRARCRTSRRARPSTW